MYLVSLFLVIDVYTEWCGPCAPMIANLKKIKLELGSENLHYAIVNILCFCVYNENDQVLVVYINQPSVICCCCNNIVDLKVIKKKNH